MRSSFLLFTLSENILRGQFIILLTRAALGPARHKHRVISSVVLGCPHTGGGSVVLPYHGVVWCGVTTGTILTNDLLSL